MTMTHSRTALLSVLAMGMPFAAASAGTFANITVDGDTSDWAGIAPVYIDPVEGTAPDFTNLYLANDEDFLYIRFTLDTAADPFTSNTNYYVDGDNDASTGFNIFGLPEVGSEILVQGASAFQQAGGGFNEGNLAGTTVLQSPFATSATDFEMRINRNTVGVAGSFAGQQLITSDTIKFQIQDASDLSPNAGDGFIPGQSYTFAPVPEPASLALVGLAP